MMDNQFGGVAQTKTGSFDAGLQAHMQRIYNRMGLGVFITAIVAYAVGYSPDGAPSALLNFFMQGPQMWIVMLAPLAIVWFGFNPEKMSASSLRLSFIAISVLYGISFSVIFLTFTHSSIANAFFVTTGMFAGLSLFGNLTRRNLDGLGSFAIMGVWGALILGLINIFMHSSAMSNLISVVSIIAFAGLTAWQTQQMKEMYSPRHDPELASRLSWVAALNLYISFVALFQNILRFMGDRR